MRFLSYLLFIFPFLLFAQSTDEDQVLATINQLYDGMREANTDKVEATFHPMIRLLSVGVLNDGLRVQETSVEDYLVQIGSFPPGFFDVQLQDTKVHIDMQLSTVWAEYDFYINGSLNVCGVYSFDLIKRREEWTILEITDTRRKKGCE